MNMDLVFAGCCLAPLIVAGIVVAALNLWEIFMYDHY